MISLSFYLSLFIYLTNLKEFQLTDSIEFIIFPFFPNFFVCLFVCLFVALFLE